VDSVSEIRDARARRDTNLRSRERLVESSSAIAFVITAFAFTVVGRGDVGDLRIATAATLIAMLGALGQVEFEIGRGAAVPTQLAFVPLAFLTPPGLLPLEVLIGYLVAALLGAGSFERRIVLAASSCWFCVGPALLLAVAGPPRTPSAIGALCVGALAAQVLVDYASWNLHEAQSHAAGAYRYGTRRGSTPSTRH
jgi:hypothetical protein